MRLILLVSFLVFVANKSSDSQSTAAKTTEKPKNSTGGDFDNWKKKFAKNYTATNLSAAQKNYQANAGKIAKHNANSSASYKLAANANADMTASDIKKTRKGLKVSKKLKSSGNSTTSKQLAKKNSGYVKQKYGQVNKNSLKSTNVKKSNLKGSIPDSLDYSR